MSLLKCNAGKQVHSSTGIQYTMHTYYYGIALQIELHTTVVFRFKHVRFKQDFTLPKMKEKAK